MNESYESWLESFLWKSIYYCKKGDQFSLQMGMKCNIETLIKPESKFDINKIILKSITKIPTNYR
jgi:hypothetical protein